MSEVERDGIRDVSGGSSEAEQRGIRAAKRGERENVSNMNERSEYRNQNAEAPTTSAFDAPQVPPGIAPAANDEGASAGVISHNAPRQLNPMGKAIAVVLSVLLVLTCWNSYSIEEARRMIIGDDAVPMASTGSGDELLDEVDDENIDQASNDVEGGGDAAEGDDASGGEDADDTAADDTVSEADMQAYLPKDLLDAEKVMPALSDATLKQEKDGILTPATTSEDDLKAAFANRFSFSLAVANALRTSDDAYHVGNGRVITLAPSFGNTVVSLDGGYLGGTEETDVVALTFAAPYLYEDAQGVLKQTLSREEWMARGADEAGLRAQVAFSSLPAGWTVYTEHMGQYQKHTAEEAVEGLSGTVLLRYEGVQDEHGITVSETRGQMPGATELPVAFASLVGEVPVDASVPVQAGYFVGSYTAGTNEDGMAKADSIIFPMSDDAAATVSLVAAEPQAELAATIEPFKTAEVTEGRAFASFLVHVKASKGTIAERSYALRVADEAAGPDGLGALSADGVIAFDATGMTAQEIAVIDPAFTESIVDAHRALAEVNVVSAGVADLTVTPEDPATLTADAVTGEQAGERVIYVAIPYNENALTAEEGASFAPETVHLTLWAYVNQKSVQEELVAEATAVNDMLSDEDVTYIYELESQTVTLQKAPEPEPEPAPAPVEPTQPEGNESDGQNGFEEPGDNAEQPEGDGVEIAEGESEEAPAPYDSVAPARNEDPLVRSLNALVEPLANFGISTFAIAPGSTDVITNDHFHTSLNVSRVTTSLGNNTYLVNDAEHPHLRLQVSGASTTGYFGGYSLYGDKAFKNAADAEAAGYYILNTAKQQSLVDQGKATEEQIKEWLALPLMS